MSNPNPMVRILACLLRPVIVEALQPQSVRRPRCQVEIGFSSAEVARSWREDRERRQAIQRHHKKINQGAEMLRKHFGGDWPRGERACFSFLDDHLDQEVWAEIGASALCELFQSRHPNAPVSRLSHRGDR